LSLALKSRLKVDAQSLLSTSNHGVVRLPKQEIDTVTTAKSCRYMRNRFRTSDASSWNGCSWKIDSHWRQVISVQMVLHATSAADSTPLYLQ